MSNLEGQAQGVSGTRNQRRQLEALAPHIKRIVATDVEFFKQNPRRRHRVRLSCGAEVAELEIATGNAMRAPAGEHWFTIVRKVKGARVRVFTTNSIDADTELDVPEELAHAIFDHVASLDAQESSVLGFGDDDEEAA